MKKTVILDFPIPYYGQNEEHKDAYLELCHWCKELLGKDAPDEYSEENYVNLFNALNDETLKDATKSTPKIK